MDPRGRRLLDPLEREPEASPLPEAERERPLRAPGSPLLDLQRRAGNAALSRQVARDPAIDVARAQADAQLALFMSHGYALDNFHPSTGGGLFGADVRPVLRATWWWRPCGSRYKFQSPATPFESRAGSPRSVASARLGGQGLRRPRTSSGRTRRRRRGAPMSGGRDPEACGAASATRSSRRSRTGKGLPPVDVRVVIADAPERRRRRREGAVGRRPSTSGPTDAGLEEAMSRPSVPLDEPVDRSTWRRARRTPERHRRRRTRSTSAARRGGEEARYGRGRTRPIPTPDPVRPRGKADVSAGDAAAPAEKFGRDARAPPGMPPFPVTVTGRASCEGTGRPQPARSPRNARATSRTRSSRAARKCSRRAIRKGADGATRGRRPGAASTSPSAPSRATSARSRTSSATCSALDDEYPERRPDDGEPTRRRSPVGGRPSHSALAERLIPGQQPDAGAPQREHHVANGEVVRPHHYVAFLEALGKMTGTAGPVGHRARPRAQALTARATSRSLPSSRAARPAA